MASPGPITKRSRGPRVEKLQHEVKITLVGHGFDKWAAGIIVDGVPGPLTLKMARLAGSMQGLSKAQLKKIGDGTITRHAELILLHDKERSPEMKRRARKRDTHFDKLRHELLHPPVHEGVVTFDGHSCPGWIAEWMQRARDDGRWHGVLVSGYRTPAYSESLCYAICGAPSCSGTCAGRSSNHACPPTATCVKYEGAVDVSDYAAFGVAMAHYGSPLHNSLGSRDPVHFSYAGN